MWKIMVIKVPSPCGDSDRCLTSQTSWSFELAGFKSNPPLIYPGGISAGLLLAPWQRTSSLWLGTSSSTAINHTAYLAEFLFQTLQNTLERQISQWFVGLGVFLVLPFSWHKEQLWWIHSFCHSGMGNEDTAGCASKKKKKGLFQNTNHIRPSPDVLWAFPVHHSGITSPAFHEGDPWLCPLSSVFCAMTWHDFFGYADVKQTFLLC